MHGLSADLREVESIAAGAAANPAVDVGLCLPATLIERAARAVPGLAIGAQDVHHSERGAHTGCLSAEMLRDAGALMAIVGHSERREAQRESDGEVRAKSEAGLKAGLLVILCVGENLSVREAGDAIPAVDRQLADSLPADCAIGNLAIAYEPIWAIGTGKVPSMDDIGQMHSALRSRLRQRYGEPGGNVRILYGGSVKAGNARDIFAVDNVDGALVGGASLKAADFVPIIEAAALKG